MASVGIIGAGIAGLTAAHRLHRAGIDVTVLEATDRPGGKIRSERAEGYLLEHGPNTVQTATPLMNRLIADLGLEGDVVEADAAAKKRYVVRDGVPRPLPTSPLHILTTDLFSLTAKLRLLGEPFIPPNRDADDESVADFARRRLGREVLDYGLNPFVGGIFAGDPEQLSVRHAFSRLHALEHEHGSLFRGLLHTARSGSANRDDADDAGPARRMFSFRQGLQQLPDALADALGPSSVRYGTSVVGMHRDGGAWRLMAQQGDAPPAAHAFDAVITTVPLPRFAALRLETPVDMAPLNDVSYPPVSVVAMGFRRADVAHPLDGFGMLVPEAETDYQILGTIFTSTIFPDRTPADHVLLTTFVGGARRPALGRAPDAEQQAAIEADLQALLGVRAAPAFVRPVRWPHAIPQYTLGYGAVKQTLDRLEATHPRLLFAGNYRNGISVGDAMASGRHAARRCKDALTPAATTAP